jgi:dextranase
VDIPSTFYDFIAVARERFPEAALTFNAVGNWPIDALAPAPLDFNYIEIWPPTPTYEDLRRIVLESRLKSADKPVVIALYLPADQEANIRLADAIIFASGGSRIEIGETDRLLSDPYFPKHQAIPEDLHRVLKRYYDFAVRYGEWMGPSALDVHGLGLSSPEGVWTVVRQAGDWLVLHFINMNGLEGARWDEAIPAPEPLGEFSVEISTPESIRTIWWGSPDREHLELWPAEWRVENESVVVDVPYLKYWTLLAVQIEGLE